MRRRRLTMFVIPLVLVAVGAAWWLLSDGLSADERRLVGRWRNSDPMSATSVFGADRRCWREGGSMPAPATDAETPTRSSIKGDRLYYDLEPSPFRRFLRPVAAYLGLRVNGAMSYQIEFVGDRLVFHQPNGSEVVCERVGD